MLIVRCIGENSFYVEKVVLPSEIIAFEAPKDARVEIWGSDLSGVHIGEIIAALTLTAIIRTLIFIQLIITNCFIIAGNIRHWNDNAPVESNLTINSNVTGGTHYENNRRTY